MSIRSRCREHTAIQENSQSSHRRQDELMSVGSSMLPVRASSHVEAARNADGFEERLVMADHQQGPVVGA